MMRGGSLHVVVVPSYGEREAARNQSSICLEVGYLQGTASKHSLLVVVESNCTELLPIAN